jgi:type IV pilus assembly protein PilE
MSMRNERLANRATGFTLVELMVTIVIGTILLGIAIPSYQSQIRKSRRVEARNAVLDLASREERFFSTANAYTNDPPSLGYSAFGVANPVGSGYYYLTVTVQAADPTIPQLAGYTITATATGTQQVKDTACQQFIVNQIGQQSSVDGSNVTTTGSASTCWN